MAIKELIPGKLYYSIGEVADLFQVNTSLIRFWEKEFDILKPAKNKKGNRLFTTEDIENLKIIYHLVKEKGYTLQGARDHLRMTRKKTPDNKEALDQLLRIRKMLSDLKRSV